MYVDMAIYETVSIIPHFGGVQAPRRTRLNPTPSSSLAVVPLSVLSYFTRTSTETFVISFLSIASATSLPNLVSSIFPLPSILFRFSFHQISTVSPTLSVTFSL